MKAKSVSGLANRDWLPLAEAAKYLSKCLDDEVSEADVLQLGLTSNLVISFRTSKDIPLRRLELQEYKGIDYDRAHLNEVYVDGHAPSESDEQILQERQRTLRLGGKYWQKGQQIHFLTGIFDLPISNAAQSVKASLSVDLLSRAKSSLEFGARSLALSQYAPDVECITVDSTFILRTMPP